MTLEDALEEAELEVSKSEREKVEEALRASEKRFSERIQESLIPTFVIDDRHLITHWNTACEILTGITVGEVIGTKKQWLAFYGEERPVLADLILNKSTEKEMAEYYGEKLRRSVLIEGAWEADDFFPDLGEEGRWLFFNASPLRDTKGKIIGAIETLQDFIEPRSTRDKLERKIRGLEIFHKAAVGREMKMIELKKEVNALLEKSGKPKKYECSCA